MVGSHNAAQNSPFLVVTVWQRQPLCILGEGNVRGMERWGAASELLNVTSVLCIPAPAKFPKFA